MNIDKTIVKEVVVATSPEELWDKWTSNAGIQSFFAPDSNVELKIGGAFEMYFMKDAPKGGQGSEGCQIISYLPNKMLSFTWNAPPLFPEIRESGIYTWVVLEFVAASEKFTLLRLTHLGWREDGDWPKVYDYFDSAWERVLSNLEQSFEKGEIE